MSSNCNSRKTAPLKVINIENGLLAFLLKNDSRLAI